MTHLDCRVGARGKVTALEAYFTALAYPTAAPPLSPIGAIAMNEAPPVNFDAVAASGMASGLVLCCAESAIYFNFAAQAQSLLGGSHFLER